MNLKHLLKYTYLTLLVSLLSCNESKPQSPKDIKNFEVTLKKENLRTLFLGAINFCSDVDYTKFLDNPRSNNEYKNGGNCCTNSVRKPYINLSEYFIYAMEGDRSIFDNQNNPFKLKEIRKNWKTKVEKVRKEAESLNPEELTYKGFKNVSVKTYDLESEELKLNGLRFSINFDGIQGDWYGTLDFRYTSGKAPYAKGIKLSSKEAEKLFQYYEDNKRYPDLAPNKQLNTIITYALEKPKRDHKLSKLNARVKKVEFFYPDGWDKKIGEATKFDY